MGISATRGQAPSLSGPAAAAHLFALSGFAVAQPLFDLLSRQAEFLIAHDARPIDLLAIALGSSFVPPLALLLVALAARLLSRSIGWWIHLAQVAGLAALIASLFLKRLAPQLAGPGWLAAAALLSVGATASYARWRRCRRFLSFLAPAALLFPVLFLFGMPVREMLLTGIARDAPRSIPISAPLVMVILDELPLSSLLDGSGEIDSVRYPNLSALSRDAYWFRDATTVAAGTVLSVPIILSGRLPDDQRLPVAAQYPDNLFTWLGAAGYRMRVFEAASRLCPRELCSARPRRSLEERWDRLATDLGVIYLHLLLPPDLASRLPPIDGTWRNFAASTAGGRLRRMLGLAPAAQDPRLRRDSPWQFARFLESLVPGERPGLHFIHLMLPHLPWRFLPSGKEYGPLGAPLFPHGVRHEKWGDDEWEVVQGLQRHLLQVGYVDRLIGQLVTRLRRQKLYDPALIVIVADHGAGFRPGESRRGASQAYFADVLNVPLIVKLPGQTRGVLSDHNVETIDVLPTIAAGLELSLPWAVDGRSALVRELPERSSKLTLRALVDEGGYSRQVWSIASLRADRALSVKRKLHLFGSGTEAGGLFRIGRRVDLLGRRVSDAVAEEPRVAESEVTIELDQPWTFEEVDPTGPFVPAHVTGRVRFSVQQAAPVDLAIAINGTVEAVTRTFDHQAERARFTAMVREEALVAGRNLVEVFEILAGPGTRALLPTRVSSTAGFTLIDRPGRAAIRSIDGRLISLQARSLDGFARIHRNRIGTWLIGWAAVGEGLEPAETLLVFIDGRLALATGNGLKPDIDRARTSDAWQRRAGFRIQLPGPLLTPASELRLIAILGERASEIVVR